MKTPKSFEAGLARLQEIMDLLADETTPVSVALKLYAEAAELIQYCEQELNGVRAQMEEIDLKMGLAQKEEPDDGNL